MATAAKKEKKSPDKALKEAFAELGELLGEVHEHISDDTAVQSETRAADIARLIARLRNVINTLIRPRDELTKALRDWVAAHPTGWIQAATVEKTFLCWIAADGKVQVVLVDSPTHELSVDDLLALVGLKGALPFLSTNYAAVRRAAESGTLKDAEGKRVPFEEILKRRVRKAREKRVDITLPDPADAAPIVAVIDPGIALQRLEQLESFGLSAATVTALGKNGIETAWQLKHLSGDEMAALDGIGVKRAGEIMAAIVRRAR